MKNLIALFLLLPVAAIPQTKSGSIQNLPVHCMDLKSIENILGDFDELPIIEGKSFRKVENQHVQNSLVIFMNDGDRSWTIVEKTVTGMYCVIAVGVALEVVPNKIREELIKKRQRSRS